MALLALWPDAVVSSGMSIRHRIRVRYSETDRMGVAHHSSYVAWLEEARIEAIRHWGHSYRDLEDHEGLRMPVVDLQLHYRQPVYFDDELELVTTVESEGRIKLRFVTQIMHGAACCAEGSVTIATVDRHGKPARVPEAIRQAIAAM